MASPRRSSLAPAVLAALLAVAARGHGARILGVFPVTSVSHSVVYNPLMAELARRGHQVVVVTPVPLDDPPANYTQVDLSAFAFVRDKFDVAAMAEGGATSRFELTSAIMDYGVSYCDEMLAHEGIRQLVSPDSGERFDLVFVEQYFTFCVYGFGHRFSAPMIGILSMPPYGVGHDSVGNPTAPSYIPEIYTPHDDAMGFWERLDNLVYGLRFRHLVYGTTFPRQHAVARKHFGASLPSLWQLHHNCSMLFVNYEPSLHPPRPQVPAVVHFSGLHLAPLKPLLQDIQQFLDSAPKGAIYVSLGSNVRSDKLSAKSRAVFLKAFAELRGFHVLWKFESDNLPGLPGNVLIRKWLPQQDVLRHPKVKLFIMQGGLQSLEEAIDSGVPVIGIPFFSDQFHNLKRIVRKGIGVRMDIQDITKEKLINATKQILQDESFRENIRRLKTIMNDQPQTSMEKVIWWTEYVIRHRGAKHLRTAALDLQWYQLLLLDVVAALLIAVLLAFLVLWRATGFVWRKLRAPAIRKQKKN